MEPADALRIKLCKVFSRGVQMARLKGLRIVVVEDQFFLAQDLTRGLREEGAEVDGPFSTVSDALESLSGKKVDAALVDIELRNGETSYELARSLRELDVPFIFVTGVNAVELPEEFRGIEIFQKPVSKNILVDKILSLK